MKKLILSTVLAAAISAGAAAPAHAADTDGRDFLVWQKNFGPVAILIGMLVPAIQKVRG
jgi:hypothetical protein